MPRHLPRGDEALSRIGPGQPVWDVPIRLFHWLLVALIGFSWWSAENDHVDWHIWSGCAILTLLIFRLLWGLVGSSTARFSSFVRGPRTVVDYLRGRWRGIGHTPLGALSVLGMLLAVAVQVGLGLINEDDDGLYAGPLAHLVSLDVSEAAHDLHEDWFYVVLGLIALHVAAIVYYRIRGRSLVTPMITGKADPEPGTQPLRPGKWWVALICIGIAIGVTRWVIAGAPPFWA
ncbi:MAG TPA: cytochrome b/b6 domain-containing protein [Sphingomicrobium sp.]|nr:cytochrome b/b6 domain-containing protein [Sphingomicrobium sp.]